MPDDNITALQPSLFVTTMENTQWKLRLKTVNNIYKTFKDYHTLQFFFKNSSTFVKKMGRLLYRVTSDQFWHTIVNCPANSC